MEKKGWYKIIDILKSRQWKTTIHYHLFQEYWDKKGVHKVGFKIKIQQ